MDNIKHIFFDLDHTLWDFNKNSKLTFQQIFNDQNMVMDMNAFEEVYMPINERYWKLYREERVNQSSLRYGRLKDTFDALSLRVKDETINLIAKEYINNLSSFTHLVEGTIDLLDYLKQKYQLHIITNGFDEIQYKKLNNSKIADYFDVIVTSDSVGVKKPNPRVFEYAVKSAKSIAQDCVMVGDSYEADVLGSFKTGMIPIHFSDNNIHQIPDKNFISVPKLADIKQYL